MIRRPIVEVRAQVWRRAVLALGVVAGSVSVACAAAPHFSLAPIARPADAPAEIELYDGPPPGSQGLERRESWGLLSTPDGTAGAIVWNVTRPTLSAILPDPAKATGAAVILAPGGAFLSLSMDTEGWRAARWLADHGVAAFVLKYRTNETPSDPKAFMANVDRVMAAAAAGNGSGAAAIQDRFAVEDGEAAVRKVRAEAKRWHIDPKRLGLVGFSAGAMTALSVVLADEPDARPGFVGLIYPPMDRVAPPADAPPAFIALASNDGLFGHAGFGLVSAWRDAGLPIEFHYYDAGDHGFGMRRQGTTSDHWIEEFYWWMQDRHLVDVAGAKPAI